jgi:hypothetical protein
LHDGEKLRSLQGKAPNERDELSDRPACPPVPFETSEAAMPSLFSRHLPTPGTLARRFRRLALIVGLACWLTACQKSEAPQPTMAGTPPPTAGAQPAPPPVPQPAPPPADAAKGDPEPGASPTAAPPMPAPPQASIEPPRPEYQQQQQQASAEPPRYKYQRPQNHNNAEWQRYESQKQQQATGKAPLPPAITRPPAAANGSAGTTRPPPKYSARPPSAAPRPAPEAAAARPPAAAADPSPAAVDSAPPPTTASLPPPAIAAFDWPPPKASAQEAIPDKWLRTGPAPTLADVADKFEKAMKLAGYPQRSYYSVPRGFALAAQFEHIRADGTPLPGEDRWRVGPPRVGNLSLLAFIQALAHAPAGIYRAIVFVVTDAPWSQSPTAPSDEQIMAWAGAGAASLPAAIGDLPYGPGYRAHALIYEFRKGSSGPAETVLPSAVSGEIHLDKGGLWDPLSIL